MIALKIVEQKAEFLTCTPKIEKVIEYACRTCYRSHDKITSNSAEKIFKQVVSINGHESVAEHSTITMYLTTDRTTLAQLTRHRVGMSYSVESQRYCNYSKGKFGNDVTFIKPVQLEEGTLEYKHWEIAMRNAENTYFELLNLGCKPEVARSVLPNSTKCELTVTGNIRAWRHFFELRHSSHAQKDIQVLCELIYEEMVGRGVPEYFFDDIMKGK